MALRLWYQDLTTRLTTHELARPLASRRSSRVPRRTDELRVRRLQGWQHAARDPGNGWLSGRFAGARRAVGSRGSICRPIAPALTCSFACFPRSSPDPSLRALASRRDLRMPLAGLRVSTATTRAAAGRDPPFRAIAARALRGPAGPPGDLATPLTGLVDGLGYQQCWPYGIDRNPGSMIDK